MDPSNTCLSQNVKEIYNLAVCGINYEVGQENNEFIVDDIFMNFHNIYKHVCETIPYDVGSVLWFRETARRLLPLLVKFSSTLEIFTMLDYSKLESCLKWTSEPSLLKFYWNEIKTEDCVVRLEILLCLTSVLERSLGDLLTTLDRDTKVPSLLKDLLLTPELKDVLGVECITVLRVMFGSPHSVNLRNVLWHGFLFTEEISLVFVPTVYLMLTSVGYILQDKMVNINKRMSVSVAQIEEINWTNMTGTLDKIDITNLAERSDLMYLNNIQMLEHILEFRMCHEYFRSCLLLLPLVETTCRKLFVIVNECPDRMLTAEATCLYTTFSEMLDKDMETGERNMLVDMMGVDLMLALQDMMTLGPRVRDRMGHGEVLLINNVHMRILSDLLITVFIVVISRRLDPSPISDKLVKAMNSFTDYRSAFHPYPMLAKQLVNNFRLLEEVTKIIVTSEEDFKIELIAPSSSLTSQLSDYRGSCLHRPRAEYELITVLQKIANTLSICIISMVNNWKEKQELLETRSLRSRQRLTFTRMKNVIPTSYRTLVDTNCMLGDILLSKEKVIVCSGVVKMLRQVVKVVENIASNVSKERNKWDEVDKLTRELKEQICRIKKKSYSHRQSDSLNEPDQNT